MAIETTIESSDDLLMRARDHAEEVSKAKSDFISRMSHELRTPLSAVLGFAELLEMEELDDRQREYVGAIVKAGNHMVRLINDVLDISRIEAGRMSLSLEPVPVSSLLYDTVNLIRPLGRPRKITVKTSFANTALTHVVADAQKLQQVLVNLGANAIKYNREGGDVLITVSSAGPERSRIEVVDTGVGIAGHHLGRLFTPFDRLDAGETHVEGTGLGLALSKHLTEAMGGAIGVSSTPGEGSSFWIELPAVSVPDPAQVIEAQAGSVPPTTYASPKTVLYIEDTASNVELITRVLGLRPSVTLVTATHGERAVQLAREHSVDLILLDMHLPDIDGEEVLQRLKSDPQTRDIPVIGLSADASPARIKRVYAGGARHYVTKPVNVKTFLETIDGVLAG